MLSRCQSKAGKWMEEKKKGTPRSTTTGAIAAEEVLRKLDGGPRCWKFTKRAGNESEGTLRFEDGIITFYRKGAKKVASGSFYELYRHLKCGMVMP